MSLAWANAMRASICRRACFVKKSASMVSLALVALLSKCKLVGRTECGLERNHIFLDVSSSSEAWEKLPLTVLDDRILGYVDRKGSRPIWMRHLCAAVRPAGKRLRLRQLRTGLRAVRAGTLSVRGRFIHKADLQVHACRTNEKSSLATVLLKRPHDRLTHHLAAANEDLAYVAACWIDWAANHSLNPLPAVGGSPCDRCVSGDWTNAKVSTNNILLPSKPIKSQNSCTAQPMRRSHYIKSRHPPFVQHQRLSSILVHDAHKTI